jgi:hypothetical protein
VPQRDPQDHHTPECRHGVVIAAFAPSSAERVEQFVIGEWGEKILDRLERRVGFPECFGGNLF